MSSVAFKIVFNGSGEAVDGESTYGDSIRGEDPVFDLAIRDHAGTSVILAEMNEMRCCIIIILGVPICIPCRVAEDACFKVVYNNSGEAIAVEDLEGNEIGERLQFPLVDVKITDIRCTGLVLAQKVESGHNLLEVCYVCFYILGIRICIPYPCLASDESEQR